MKRIMTLLLITLFLNSTVISQSNCAHKDLIREFVNIADSIGRFMDNTKAAVGEVDWEAFINALKNDEGEKAFDRLGQSGESVKITLNELGYQLSGQQQKLNRAIRTDDKMTDADVKAIIDEEIYCYFSDTDENNLAKLLGAAGRSASMEIGTFGDPCEEAFRNCLSQAGAVHASGLNNCLTIASTVGGFLGWLGGIIGGLACVGAVEYNFNEAKLRCYKIYKACTNH